MSWQCRVHFLIFLFFLKTNFLLANETDLQNDFYFLTMPKALIPDIQHKFFVEVRSKVSKIQIDTVDPISKLSVHGEVEEFSGPSSEIPYQLPIVNLKNRVQLVVRIELCISGMSTNFLTCAKDKKARIFSRNESVVLPILDSGFIIFSETSKPIYKPGQLVQFRFLSIYSSNLKTSVQSKPKFAIKKVNGKFVFSSVNKEEEEIFSLIYLEDPNKIRMAQWINVTWKTAMNLSHQLTNDPVLGDWKLIAKYKGVTKEQRFTVKHYVLPKFIVTIDPPKSLIISDQFVEFSVCGQYSTGLPMKATIQSILCIRPSRGWQRNLRPCITAWGKLNRTKCHKFIVNTTGLALRQNAYSTYNCFTHVNATVTEEGTGAVIQKNANGAKLQTSTIVIHFEGADHFKLGLPYYGKITTRTHSGFIKPFTELQLIGSPYFSEKMITGIDGTVEFELPPMEKSKIITLQFEQVGPKEKYQKGVFTLNNARIWKRLKPWYSIYNSNILFYPRLALNQSDIVCPGKYPVRILSTVPLSNKDIKIQIMSRGRLVLSQTILANRNGSESCSPTNNEQGHYTCSNYNEETRLVTCLSGWTGNNCAQPECLLSCNKGICDKENSCICQKGRRGILREGCQNGVCIKGNDCKCKKGWTGFKCEKTFSKTQTGVHNSRFQQRTIFLRDINIDLSEFIFPSGQVVIFFTQNGNRGTEVVAESFTLGKVAEKCLSKNKNSTFKFNKNRTGPGKPIVLNMFAGENSSLCALRISDISLSTFGSSGGITLQTVVDNLIEINQNVLRTRYSQNPYSGIMKKLCRHRKTSTNRFSRMYYPGDWRSIGADTAKVFETVGLFVLTNGKFINRNCYRRIGPQWRILSNPGDERMLYGEAVYRSAKIKDRQEQTDIRIRDFFPETWKFDILENPEKQLNLTTPDSITTWEANAYCITPKGLWTAQPAVLKVMMPFFIQQTLPYSVKRREIVHIPVKLFNYLAECYQVNVHLKASSDYEIVGQTAVTTCLCDLEQSTVYFKLYPVTIGEIDVVVSAKSRSSVFCPNKNRPQLAGNSIWTDATRRKLLVEPEGFPQELNIGDIVCVENNKAKSVHNIDLPDPVVEGSERVYMTFGGDIMGSALTNLDHLVRMPYGCGEQNMVSMVPSIYVLNYFLAAKINKPDIITKAKEFIQIGYKRQLNYRREDGSFSAFGERDKEGSTWLTAFVLGSFKEAAKYTKVNRIILTTAQEFLQKRQNVSDGCFEERGIVFTSNMKGGIGRSGDERILLTAYVLIAISDKSNSRIMIKKALFCLKNHLQRDNAVENLNTYSLAVLTYALSLHKPGNIFTNALRIDLQRRASKSIHTEYWSDTAKEQLKYSAKPWMKGTSVEVETTAYGYLALERNRNIAESMKAARWLASQRSSLGGFYSTQDTVMGLKCLANFAGKLIHGVGTDMTVDITFGNKKTTKIISNVNRLVTNKFDFSETDQQNSPVQWTIAGNGCIFVQTSVLFNQPKPSNSVSPYALSVSAVQTLEKCDEASLTLCFKYIHETIDSNMLLLSVDLVSGWKLKVEKLNSLVAQYLGIGLKRVEFEKKTVLFYFDPIGKGDDKLRCIEINLTQHNRVDDVKEANVLISDYYSPEISLEKTYSLKSCKSAEEKDVDVDKPEIEPKINCPAICYLNEIPDISVIKMKMCSESKTIIAEPNVNSSVYTMMMLEVSDISAWTARLHQSSCKCDLSQNNSTVLLITTDSDKVRIGGPVVLNSNFLVVKVTPKLTDTLRRTSWCRNSLMISRVLTSLNEQLSDAVLPREQMCPTCIVSFDEALFPWIEDRLCQGVQMNVPRLSKASLFNETFELQGNSLNITELRFAFTDCECNLRAIFEDTSLTASLVRAKDTPMQEEDGSLTLNGNFVLMRNNSFELYAKMCNGEN